MPSGISRNLLSGVARGVEAFHHAGLGAETAQPSTVIADPLVRHAGKLDAIRNK